MRKPNWICSQKTELYWLKNLITNNIIIYNIYKYIQIVIKVLLYIVYIELSIGQFLLFLWLFWQSWLIYNHFISWLWKFLKSTGLITRYRHIWRIITSETPPWIDISRIHPGSSTFNVSLPKTELIKFIQLYPPTCNSSTPYNI